MANVINCVECGKLVSRGLTKCPHCGLRPDPVRCYPCGSQTRISAAKTLWVVGYPDMYCCPTCTAEVTKKANQIVRNEICRCPSCNTQHSNTTFRFAYEEYINGEGRYIKEQAPCPICGQPLATGNCSVCYTPMLLWSGVRAKDVYEETHYEEGGSSHKTLSRKNVYVHNDCATWIDYKRRLFERRDNTFFGVHILYILGGIIIMIILLLYRIFG